MQFVISLPTKIFVSFIDLSSLRANPNIHGTYGASDIRMENRINRENVTFSQH